MAEPTLKVEVAFDSPAFSASPTWTDVTDYVRQVDVTRGRNMELSGFEAGTLTITFDNEDGRFTPRQTPVAGQPTLRPRRAVRATATYSAVTYPLGYGFIERWPAAVGDGAYMATIPTTDAFRLLSDTNLPDSDTGWLTKAKPKHYWPLQDDASPMADVIAGKWMRPFWSSQNPKGDADTAAAAASTTVPDIQYSASSNLNSGAGVSVNLGSQFNMGGVNGSWGLYSTIDDMNFNNNAPFSVTMQCIVPSLTRADGTNTVLVSTATKDGSASRDVLSVKPDGSIYCLTGIQIAPAGTFQANTFYRVSMSYWWEAPSGPSVYHFGLMLNGTLYRFDGSVGLVTEPIGEYLTIAGRGALDSGGAGGRWSHVALWDRALSDTELLRLWGDYVCGAGLTADVRINRVLDFAGWPTGMRDIQAGKSTLVQDSWSENTSLLSLIQKWAAADNGLLYVSDDGKVTYRNRHARLSTYPTPSFTFDCSADTGVEAGLEWVMDEDDVRNVVNLDVNYGIKAQFRDEASIADYGEKPVDMKLDIQSDAEGQDAAQFFLSIYAQPLIRVSGVTLYPSSVPSGNLWVAALSADIGTVIRLANLPAQAPAAQLDYVVESVRHSITRVGGVLQWVTSYDVSPVAPTAWVLDDTQMSVLGTTTRLAY